jgi:hypothetical protein
MNRPSTECVQDIYAMHGIKIEGRAMNESIIEGWSEALSAVKRDLRILTALESKLAAAPVAFKLVDCLTAFVDRDFKQALADLWACSSVVRKNLYNSMSEHCGKIATVAMGARRALDDCDHKLASTQYMVACIEIVKGTKFETVFEEPNNENS